MSKRYFDEESRYDFLSHRDGSSRQSFSAGDDGTIDVKKLQDSEKKLKDEKAKLEERVKKLTDAKSDTEKKASDETKKSAELAKKNSDLKAEIEKLKAEVEKLKSAPSAQPAAKRTVVDFSGLIGHEAEEVLRNADIIANAANLIEVLGEKSRRRKQILSSNIYDN